MADSKMAPSASADTRKLIGRNIKNAEGETIGEIKSIYINKDGKVDSVMVGVGGFLGVGDREVRIAWSDLKITDNGEKVMVNMTKDELKAKPEYRYKNEAWRGQVFSDTGPWAARPGDAARTADAPRPGGNGPGVETTRVEGPICESTDALGVHDLPPLRRGDLVAIADTGAYAASLASTYNGRPRGPQVFIEPDGTVRLARRARR